MRLVPLCLMAMAAAAHADWTLVRADAPVTTIHATSVYQAEAGQRFAQDDIVENPSGGVVQIQDESGNILALGQDTDVMLTHDAHVALLRGWLKVQAQAQAEVHDPHACSAANCATPVIETGRTRLTPADSTALVIAATPPGYDNADAVFCESGSAQVLALAKLRSKPAEVRLDTHQFALRANGNESIVVSASSNPAFVAAMPVAFRDALHPLPLPLPARAVPAQGLRPVTYAEISDWLVSALPARTDPATRFTDHFRARLSDPAFRRDIRQHIRDLPDWRPLVFPPPRRVSQFEPRQPSSAYSSPSARP
jgi:hypothetical protein